MDELRKEKVNQIENRTIPFISKMETFVIQYEKLTLQIIEQYGTSANKFIRFYDLIACKFMLVFETIITRLKNPIMSLYRLARLSTIPFNHIWIWLWKRFRYGEGNLLKARGVHYVFALQGGGKSSLLFDTIEEMRIDTGKGAYVNVSLERPRIEPINNMYYLYHRRYEFDEFWGMYHDPDKDEMKLSQLKQFDTEKWDNLVMDEWLSNMNHRMNNTSVYKQVFIPLMGSLSRMRHQGLKRVYIASQIDTADVQLMQLFKYIHEIEVDLDIEYWQWVEDGMFSDHIKGWSIWTYQYRRNKKKSSTEKVLVKKWYRKRTSDMTYFDSLNQVSEYKNLPVDNVRIMKRG